jgi:riboflavin kinase/FMN adenylyltransferase
MKIIRHLNRFSTENNSIITIGAFDGVHLGHQAVILKLKEIAKVKNLIPYVIFFEPLPKEYFQKEKAPNRVSSLRDKIITLRKYGIENIICIRFNEKFTNIEATDFIEKYLVSTLKTKHIIIGDDFKFGKARKGDFDLLQEYSTNHDFAVAKLSTLNIENHRISSSLVRNAFKEHDLPKVRQLTNRQIVVTGRVIHGQKNGRKIGFNTANLKLPKNSVLKGVYLTKVTIDSKSYFGVTNAGTRPTVCGKHNLLETHIFDFNQDIYQKHICVEMLEFIRPEKKFDSFDELKSQIAKDITTAKNLIKIF